jgi:nucleotide-binding universal stress UspA family protein
VTGSDATTVRSVFVWICEGTWPASVDAALSLAPPGARITLLHVTSQAPADAARGAYRGLLGRAGPGPGEQLDALAAAAAADLVDEAARRLGRDCDRLEIHGQPERAVVAAAVNADLLVVARDGDRSRLGPKSLGKETRFVVDHAPCQVLLVWPEAVPGTGTIPPPPHHPHHGGRRHGNPDRQGDGL